MQEEIENKIRGIMGLYNFYKHDMNTIQRVGLLTIWLEQSIEREEYEVAAALKKELDRIITGEEEFLVTAPSVTNMLEEEKRIEKESSENKKLRLVNYWRLKEFHFFNISFKPFKLIFLNLGFEWA